MLSACHRAAGRIHVLNHHRSPIEACRRRYPSRSRGTSVPKQQADLITVADFCGRARRPRLPLRCPICPWHRCPQRCEKYSSGDEGSCLRARSRRRQSVRGVQNRRLNHATLEGGNKDMRLERRRTLVAFRQLFCCANVFVCRLPRISGTLMDGIRRLDRLHTMVGSLDYYYIV